MGHRKKHAPKRGSLSYLPRGRASRWMGRVRFWPEVIGQPRLLGFVGYKAGMTHLLATDNKKGSFTFGKEVLLAVTVVETPPMIGTSVRVYGRTNIGLKCLTEVPAETPANDTEKPDPSLVRVSAEESMAKLMDSADRIAEVRVLMSSQPNLSATGNKRPEHIEVKVAGGTVKEQLDFAKGMLGKEIKASQVFREGEIVDLVGVTKGKGIQGPVKRWGIRRRSHKSRKGARKVGSIGPWNPSYVVYTVPRAGQMGFHQRTEYSKQIMKIGEDGIEVTPKGGFTKYGRVNNNYVMIAGSVPGPPKRVVTMRYGARAPTVGEPTYKIEYISLHEKSQVA